MSGVRRRPPKAFASAPLDVVTIGPGTTGRRIYPSIHQDPLGVGQSPSRFSDPRINLPPAARFAVLYLGSTLKVCFLEAVLRDRRNGKVGDIPIPYAELQSWTCADIAATEPLTLVDLRGDGLVRMGVPTDAVRASRHHWGQLWALGFWAHGSAPDGIIYPSRLNEKVAIAVFDRAFPKLAATSVRPLLDCRAAMADIIRTFKLAIL